MPTAVTSELGRLIARRIALTGPISVADFMAEALGHPRLGYYRHARPLGAAGDFTTAPEISQMFGELIGAWLAERWLAMGRPSPVALVELGPGRGTLMADALRATRGVPGFHAALSLHLVETNDALRAEQQRALAAFESDLARALRRGAGRPDAAGRQRVLRRPAGPPVREDRAGLARAHGRPGARRRDARCSPWRPAPRRSRASCPTRPTARRRRSAKRGRALAAAIGARVTRDGGWALIIDYGYDRRARPPRCRRCAATRARPSSTGRAKPTSARMSTSPPWPRPRAGADLRSGVARPTSCGGWDPAACGNPQGARQPRPSAAPSTWRLARLIGARPNGHLVPRPGRR